MPMELPGANGARYAPLVVDMDLEDGACGGGVQGVARLRGRTASPGHRPVVLASSTMGIAGILVALHVAANVVWIGSILAVGRVIEVNEGDAKLRGALALKVYKGLAVP